MTSITYIALFLSLSVGTTLAVCPPGFQHMTSVNCGTLGGKTVKLLTCSTFHAENATNYFCTPPTFAWMYNICVNKFGQGGTYNPIWEKTESSCYPDESNAQYWLDYNGYTLNGSFCSNFPRVKKTNNIQFERGTLLFWTAHPSVFVVTQEDGIVPPDAKFSKYMAKLVSVGSDVVTLFRDDFFVPSCVKSVQFWYNFLTMEYGAAAFPDFMRIVIEDNNGMLLKEVVVAQASIQDQPGSPGGKWLHISGWKKVWFSMAGLPINQVIRLKFYVDVRNVGDEVFDSAVLVDRLKYNM
jgi:hypothetical protein